MSAVTALPWARELTVDDLDALPDDGHRYELVDGALIVTPAPSKDHQRALRGLVTALLPVVPAGFELLWAPTDVRTSSRTNLHVESGHAEGDEPLVLERPFAVRIVPKELVP
jgi:hypothetical protein